MPELPEVETIKNELREILPFQIQKYSLSTHLRPRILKQSEIDLSGQTIHRIERHGKWLLFNMGGDHIFSHLGMSGAWIISQKLLDEKHCHLTLYGNNAHLNYVDPRRFGSMYWLNELSSQKKLANFGPEITSSQFSFLYLQQIFKQHPRCVLKPFLLKQNYFPGIGNYLANEICAHAKLRPERTLDSIDNSQLQLLYRAFTEVLQQSIDQQGVTFQGGYRRTDGQKGEGLANLVVFYQKICRQCQSTPIIKTQLGGRGTYFCPTCQQ